MSFFCCASLVLLSFVLLSGSEKPGFNENKFRTFYVRFDRNKDGEITEEDYQLMATDYAEYAKFDKEKEKNLREKMLPAFFDSFEFHKDSSGNPVSLEEFASSLEKHRNDPKLKDIFKHWVESGYKFADWDQDGAVDYKEFIAGMMSICKLTPIQAKMTFVALDTDLSGGVTVDEFVPGVTEFFLGDDEQSPYQFIFGSIVKVEL